VSEKVTLGFLETMGSKRLVSDDPELEECSPLLHSEHDDREQCEDAEKDNLISYEEVKKSDENIREFFG